MAPLNNDKVLFFKKGKEDKNNNTRFISYTREGKVIIGEGVTCKGYYTYESLDEKPKCIIARGLKKIVYGYYTDIGYSEFKELLLKRGYSVSFEMPFKWVDWDGKTHGEMRLVAFKRDYNMVIVADTIEGMSVFNSIKCYCYGVNSYYNMSSNLFCCGDNGHSVFDLEKAKGYRDDPLRHVEIVSCKDMHVYVNPKDVPSGFTYVDNPMSKEDFRMYDRKFRDLCSSELREYLYG